ncbi:Sir2 family NAD-dependent protein deacetylase [Iodidimonas sp. SYSU 1G8]|uniref:SIR2 family NAD-dependent protein deacylase n=1 Tax=Iodidimonas sp. SYSU 1G8 TaxID=3133967 RepID=UPI0031FF0F58
MTDARAALRRMLDEARRVVVFTGAGISTESGIPDFRSPGGYWTKNKPIQFEDYMRSAEVRREAWRRKFDSDGTFETARPNKGHMAIAKLVRTGKISRVITQNVDNLHQHSGIPADRIVELHGNATYATCLMCRTRYEIDALRQAWHEDGQMPECDCGGVVKTATISFGQSMPQDEMMRARDATLDCDLFLAIGSSLVVYPAAGFPIMAHQNGAGLVILNRDPTELDGLADLVINDEIGPVMADVVGLTNADME